MKKTKIFAAYLPQYHEIKENNMFWGEGFTDWVTTKNAKPLYKGHEQPKIPLDYFYYDLSKEDVLVWQANLAKKYGIDGFNIYHYWFKDGKTVLETPANNLLNHPEIDIQYFFTWDNSSWIRTWSNVVGNDWAPTINEGSSLTVEKSPYLLEMRYEEEEAWEEHYNYLREFFRDKRYLKIDNKPVFFFFTYIDEHKLKRMADYWDNRAKSDGWNGMYYAGQRGPFRKKKIFDREFMYQPNHSGWAKKKAITKRINVNVGISSMYDYDRIWKKVIIDTFLSGKKVIPGTFVRYDDSPRRGNKGSIIDGASAVKFRKYFSIVYKLACIREQEILLLTAWNEWGEGAYLEPDIKSQNSYLEAVSHVVENIREMDYD